MIHLDLQPDLEARLASQAQAEGLSIEHYAGDLLASAIEEEEGLRGGLADIEAGRTRPAREVFT